MSNESTISPFPASRQDVSDLKQTAFDAAQDLGSTAAGHADRVKSKLRDLAGHVQEEGRQNLQSVRVKLSDLVTSTQKYATERPFVFIGAAFALGLVLGLRHRAVSKS